jgi:hypothetical protein
MPMWSLQGTKNRFSAGFDAARAGQPQRVTPPGLRAWMDTRLPVHANRLMAIDAEEARDRGPLSARPGHDGAGLLIAAPALVRGWTVVTGNLRHFEPTSAALLDPFAERGSQ